MLSSLDPKQITKSHAADVVTIRTIKGIGSKTSKGDNLI
jgi:hypothetical protein